jgi:hypothetical protein
MARNEDLTVEQNADLTHTFTIYESDGVTEKDLGSYTVAASLKNRYNSPTSISFDTTVVAPANNGIVSISLTNEQTALLDWNDRYVYDVIISSTTANTTFVERVLEGKIYVKAGVTTV